MAKKAPPSPGRQKSTDNPRTEDLIVKLSAVEKDALRDLSDELRRGGDLTASMSTLAYREVVKMLRRLKRV